MTTSAARLGDPQMQRLFDLLRQQAIRLHRQEHIRSFNTDFEIREVQAVEDFDMAQSGFHQRLRRRLTVFFLDILLQRAGVHADPNRDIVIARAIHNGTNTIFTANIARIDAQTVNPVLSHFQRDAVIEVDIGHQRYRHLLLDQFKGFRRIHGRYRNPYDIRPDALQRADLRHCRIHIGGTGVGHRLHGDRRITTNRYITHENLA